MKRSVVVVTRVAVKFGDNRPTAEWTARREPLLRSRSAPSVSRMPYTDIAWVWTCIPDRFKQVREMAGSMSIPNGAITVVPVEEMFDEPDPGFVEGIHTGRERFVTFRLDADDAYLPAAVGGISSIPPGTLVDFANGYLWNGRQMRRTGTQKQGPFLALANDGRENIINQGGQHRWAREGRTVLRVEEPAWIQSVHGENILTTFGSRRAYLRTRVGRRRAQRILASAGVTSA